MKALIWFVSFFCMAVIQMIIKDSGIILGGIPTALLFGLTWFVAQKLCKKWDNRKKEATADTHKDEPIVEIVSETDAEITPPKKFKKDVPTVLTKVSSFFLKYRKVFLILTIISSVLFIATLITYNTLDTYRGNVLEHYRETSEFSFDPYCTMFGCGLTSCSYCKGEIIVCSGYAEYYELQKCRFLYDVSIFLEGCLHVFALFAIVGLPSLIISFVHHRKHNSKADTLQDT